MQTLNRFLQQHEKRAYSFAKLALNHREDALDAVQEAMLAMASRYAEKHENTWEKPPVRSQRKEQVPPSQLNACFEKKTKSQKSTISFCNMPGRLVPRARV